MFNRRRIALVIAGACLLLASGAAAALRESFRAAVTPAYVQPETTRSYTLTLTNDASSGPDGADRATILPDGFEIVGAPSPQPITGCASSPTWQAEVLPDGKTISLTRTGNPTDNNLCPGGSLTVVFSAKAPATEKAYPWPAAMFYGVEALPPPDPQPTVIVDGIPPDTTISSGPPTPTNQTSANFSFDSSETGSIFQCSLDDEDFATCTSPRPYSGLADGPHTFAVRAIDLAGNTGPETSHSWTIETRAPTASVTSGPAALSNSRSATFAFSADEPSSFECQLDGGSFQACGSPASYQGLGDGTHTFAVRPTDAAGNTGAASSHGWRVDGTAPETTLGSGPRSGTTALSGTFTFSASEPAAFECKLDSAAFAPCTSPKSHAGLTRREHTFEVRAIDAAGNPDPTPAIHRWTIAAAPRRAATTSALLAPRAGARVTSPPLLVWRRAARASYYNVQLYRGRVKVLSSWPVRTRLQLRARWTYLGRQRQLAPGAYRWYVWPGYGRPSARRYGRLLGQSTFTMTPRR
jgi:hypothetical protein